MKDNKVTIPFRKLCVYVASAVGISEMLTSQEGLPTLILATMCFIALVLDIIKN